MRKPPVEFSLTAVARLSCLQRDATSRFHVMDQRAAFRCSTAASLQRRVRSNAPILVVSVLGMAGRRVCNEARPSSCGLVVEWSVRWTCDLEIAGSTFQCHVKTLGKLYGKVFAHTHTHTQIPMSPSSTATTGTGQRAVMPYGWEGNRRSGVALAVRHRLQSKPRVSEMSTRYRHSSSWGRPMVGTLFTFVCSFGGE